MQRLLLWRWRSCKHQLELLLPYYRIIDCQLNLNCTQPWASAEIFPRGATPTFRLSFFRLRTMQCKCTFRKRFTRSTPQRNSPSKHAFCSHFLKSYSGGVVFEFAKGLYSTLSSFTAFAESGYHPISLLLWTADNWVGMGLELSTTAFAVLTLVCAGWTSLLKI